MRIEEEARRSEGKEEVDEKEEEVEEDEGGQRWWVVCMGPIFKKKMTTVPWRLWQIKSQAKRRICWSPQMRNSLRSSLLACFLDLCWPLQLQAAMNTLCFLLRAVFLITSSFPGMETQVVPQINTIKTRLDSFLYLYSTPIALLIKGNNPQNTFQVV